MQKRHLERELYFREQEVTSKKHVIPFLRELIDINEKTSVLEIGCKRIVGVDMSEGKIFLGFPPCHNPFGGHHQMCKSKFLSKLPFFNILQITEKVYH